MKKTTGQYYNNEEEIYIGDIITGWYGDTTTINNECFIVQKGGLIEEGNDISAEGNDICAFDRFGITLNKNKKYVKKYGIGEIYHDWRDLECIKTAIKLGNIYDKEEYLEIFEKVEI
jgi:hypothetical protein